MHSEHHRPLIYHKRDTIIAIAETVTEIQSEVEVQTVRTTTEDKIKEELPEKV
jgi:hypothetical protein